MAMAYIVVAQGKGTIMVYDENAKYLGLVSEVTGKKSFTLSFVGTLQLRATPGGGYKFDKYCTSSGCTTDPNRNFLYISAAGQTIEAYFSVDSTASPPCQPTIWTCENALSPTKMTGYEISNCGTKRANANCTPYTPPPAQVPPPANNTGNTGNTVIVDNTKTEVPIDGKCAAGATLNATTGLCETPLLSDAEKKLMLQAAVGLMAFMMLMSIMRR